jgi:hypothetical protein
MRIKLDKLDVLFSQFIRMRAIQLVGGCERCLSPKKDYKQLQTSHFFGRSRRSVRWDEDNAIGTCGACHIYFGSHPLEHTEWFRNHLGEEKLDMLQGRMRQTHPKPDRSLIEIYLKQRLKEQQSTAIWKL